MDLAQPGVFSNLVHLSGTAVNGLQRCMRCSEILTEPGLTPFPPFALVRKIIRPGFTGTIVEKGANATEMCKEKKYGTKRPKTEAARN